MIVDKNDPKWMPHREAQVFNYDYLYGTRDKDPEQINKALPEVYCGETALQTRERLKTDAPELYVNASGTLLYIDMPSFKKWKNK